jgi:hypothetical protein
VISEGPAVTVAPEQPEEVPSEVQVQG